MRRAGAQWSPKPQRIYPLHPMFKTIDDAMHVLQGMLGDPNGHWEGGMEFSLCSEIYPLVIKIAH